tara:strand:+ start:5495 stop:7033 length:1539 start_codon:yes stop_codon:yes gene_type:complete
MKTLKIFGLALLCITNVLAQSNDEVLNTKIKSLEKDFETVLTRSKAAGFAIAIVKGNKIIYSKGFGYRDLENKFPMTPNTVFAIGSTTKAFTASLMGILEDKGKLDLDKSPRTYIPELEFFNSEMNAQITIKDLMTHRTGLPRHDGAWRVFAPKSKDELIPRIKFQEPVTSVRSKYRYNNIMYMLQGVIAERITEKSWGENIEESLFKPLEMTSSNTSINALKNNSQAAIGYYFEDGITTKIDYFDLIAIEPAGAINSSVTDISKWMMAWLNKGMYNDKQVLPSTYVKAAMSSQMVKSGFLPRKFDPSTFMSNYGYGWDIGSYKGHYRVDHSGNIEGFSATIALYPSDSLGIVILTNQNRSGIPQTLRNIVADKLLDTPKTEDWTARFEKLVNYQTKVREVAHIVSKKSILDVSSYTGRYTHKGYGTFDVVVKNDSLFAKFPSKKLWLNPVHPNVFDTYYVIDDKVEATYKDTSINFLINVKGKIAGLEMKLERTLDPIVFNRVPLKTEPTD